MFHKQHFSVFLHRKHWLFLDVYERLWLWGLFFLQDWAHLVDFSFCTRKTTFVTSGCFSCSQVPSKKSSTLKGKNLLPRGSKFSPFRVDPFSEGRNIFLILFKVHQWPLNSFDDFTVSAGALPVYQMSAVDNFSFWTNKFDFILGWEVRTS